VTGLPAGWWQDRAAPERWTQDGDWLLVQGVPAGGVPDLVAAIVARGGRVPGGRAAAAEPRSPLPRTAGRGVSAIATIASLTVREALRRRLIAALAVICLALVGLSSWGFYRLSHNSRMTSGEINGSLPEAFILFMFMFSFVVALSASAISAPAISSEVDSGVLQTIVTRPVRRSDVLLGKWLGLAGLLAAYTAVVCGLQVAVVYWVSGFAPPDPAAAAAFLFAEGAALLTLVLLLSTRLSTLAAGVIGVALFGMAWLSGVVGALGAAFHIQAMHTASEIFQ